MGSPTLPTEGLFANGESFGRMFLVVLLRQHVLMVGGGLV